MNEEWKIISLEALNSDVLFTHTQMCIHALTHTLNFQMPQVIYITVNDSDELHVQSLLQALCLHVHMPLGVNLISTVVVMLEMPRVKQRWLGPAEVLDLIMLYWAADLVICSVTTIAWKCLQKARPHINVQHLLLRSAGKAEVVVVTGKLGLLMRTRERFYNSHKKFNQIISAVAWKYSLMVTFLFQKSFFCILGKVTGSVPLHSTLRHPS